MEYCAVLYLVAQLYPTLCDLMDGSLPVSSIHGDFPGKNTVVDFHALLQGIFPNPEIKPWSPSLQAGSLPSEPPGKPLFNILRNSEFAPPCDSNPEKSVQLIDVTPPGGGAQEAQCLCFTYVIIFCSYNNAQTRVFSSLFSP
jgi:hypothetical protein